MAIDYAKLAKQHGGSASVDYGSLAASLGGKAENGAPAATPIQGPLSTMERLQDMSRFTQAVPGAVASVYKDLGVGALKGVGSTAAMLGKGVSKAADAIGWPQDKQIKPYEWAAEQLKPSNPVQVGGKMAESAAEFVALGGLTGLGGKAVRLAMSPGGMGTIAGANELAQGNGPVEAVKSGLEVAAINAALGHGLGKMGSKAASGTSSAAKAEASAWSKAMDLSPEAIAEGLKSGRFNDLTKPELNALYARAQKAIKPIPQSRLIQEAKAAPEPTAPKVEAKPKPAEAAPAEPAHKAAPEPPSKPSISDRVEEAEGASKAMRASTVARMKHVIKKAEPVTPTGDVVHAPPAFPGQRSGATKARYEFQAKRQAKLNAERTAEEIADRVRKLFGVGGKPSEIKKTVAEEWNLPPDAASQLVNMVRSEIK